MSEDLASVLTKVESDPAVKSVVLISGKPESFFHGADIDMLAACKTSGELQGLSENGQKMLNDLSKGKPKVAAIHGACLGGGLEVALACHYRIATESSKTVLGLPEVKLGLLPGAGGTQRLPRLVGLTTSLDLMLTGKDVRPQKAQKIKLVDQVTDPSALEHAAIQAAEELANGTRKVDRAPKSFVQKAQAWAFEANSFGRDFVFGQAKKNVTNLTLGNYPAPYKIIETIAEGYNKGFDAGLQKEAKSFGELGQTPESKALVSIFKGTTHLKKNKFGKPAKDVKTIAVLGAGLMGAGITQVSVAKGYQVLLKDINHQGLGRGLAQINKNLDGRVKRKAMTAFEKDLTLSRVVPLTDDTPSWKTHFGKADLVVEAVFENLELKHKIIKQMEEIVPSDCIIATNTSALPIHKIAEASKRPENVIGMHYFSPVDKMPLLEIITHDKTSPAVAAAAVEVGLKQGKTVIVVKDVPGFYVNRSLGPYMVETAALVEQGVDLQLLDQAMKEFGFPVGPITLADEVGTDVALHVNAFLSKHLGVRMTGGKIQLMEDLVNKGFLGKKSGKGFYLYDDKKGKKGSKEVNPEVAAILQNLRNGRAPANISKEEIQNRMAFRFINEAIFCLQDGIISGPVDGDIGAVFGIGFPPFRGGPFHYVDRIGAQKFVDTMHSFRDKYGEQFTPAPLVVDLAKSGKKFHPSI
eukprot:TRINITY_DN2603_c0_g1_i1.p1 TRINITY_DN2603_c0_g1~~TRINITY_DN2603_c0_g1_i1.p1  ORF type:complete len:784 (-),score=236.09 TRINITY_DN2603_c0_g1_i1:199-2280(-)